MVQGANGVITRKDFERYEVRWMEPARGTYRGHDVIGSPPPDNGGTHVIEALNMLEHFDLAKMGPSTESAESLYWMNRIVNETFVDGGKQTDPATHDVPLDYITSKEYAAARLRLLRMTPQREVGKAPSPGSNHVTVIDAKGNVATILHSVMALPWQNGLYAMGLSIAASGGHFARIMPAPGDRASAFVAPTIILKGGKPVLAAGSPSVGLLQNLVQNTVNIHRRPAGSGRARDADGEECAAADTHPRAVAGPQSRESRAADAAWRRAQQGGPRPPSRASDMAAWEQIEGWVVAAQEM